MIDGFDLDFIRKMESSVLYEQVGIVYGIHAHTIHNNVQASTVVFQGRVMSYDMLEVRFSTCSVLSVQDLESEVAFL